MDCTFKNVLLISPNDKISLVTQVRIQYQAKMKQNKNFVSEKKKKAEFFSSLWIFLLALFVLGNLLSFLGEPWDHWHHPIHNWSPSAQGRKKNIFDLTYSGLLQSLSALWAPAPQVLEQWDQDDQRPQPPGMLSGFLPTVIHLPAIHHWKGKRQEMHMSERFHNKLTQEL